MSLSERSLRFILEEESLFCIELPYESSEREPLARLVPEEDPPRDEEAERPSLCEPRVELLFDLVAIFSSLVGLLSLRGFVGVVVRVRV